MLGHALANTLSDLATGIGWVGMGIVLYFLLAAVCTEVFYLLRGGRRGWERREAKRLPAELAELERQRRAEIRCMGGGRRGPERICGPESRERLPLSARRSA
jgi:hypothetical protein